MKVFAQKLCGEKSWYDDNEYWMQNEWLNESINRCQNKFIENWEMNENLSIKVLINEWMRKSMNEGRMNE